MKKTGIGFKLNFLIGLAVLVDQKLKKNGKSFEEAYDLSSMGHSESVKAEYRILEKFKLKIKSRSVEMHDKSLYDIVLTNKGKVFFKLPAGD